MDKELVTLLDGMPVGTGAKEIMRSWIKGFQAAWKIDDDKDNEHLDRIGKARELGVQAYYGEISRLHPGRDRKLTKLIKETPIGKSSKQLVDAWVRGWDAASKEDDKEEFGDYM
jgi:hypothetical protein